MRAVKFFILPFLVGVLASALVLWAIDGFPTLTTKYAGNQLIKSMFPCFITIVLINMTRRKKAS
jgi:hypothetical protein